MAITSRIPYWKPALLWECIVLLAVLPGYEPNPSIVEWARQRSKENHLASEICV